MITIIVAMDDKRGIGKKGSSTNSGMLWHISEDFRRFKSLTTGHPIIMGRKTHEVIGRPLPNRTNIIITRDKDYHPEGVTVVHSLDEALEIAKKSTGSDEIFITGGGQIFEQGFPLANKLYLTKVKGDFEADVFFPEYENDFPTIIESETKSEGEYTYTFETRQR